MAVYLAPFVGSGTRADPFRPAGIDGAADWTCVDLRPNEASSSGWCLVWTPGTLTDASLLELGSTPVDVLPQPVKNQLQNRLGIDLSTTATLLDVVVAILTNPNWPRPLLRKLLTGKRAFRLGPLQWVEP